MQPFCLFLLVLSIATHALAQAAASPAAYSATPATPAPHTLSPKASADTQKYRDIVYRYSPEQASADGVSKYDSKIADVSPGAQRAKLKDEDAALKKLMQVRDKEPDPAVRQELDAYIQNQQASLKQEEDALAHQVTYIDATVYVSDGLKPLLNAEVSQSRRNAATERMERYTGIDPDPQGASRVADQPNLGRSTATSVSNYNGGGVDVDRSLVTMLIQRTLEQMKKPGMTYPTRQEIEFQLAHNAEVINRMITLFREYKISAWEPPFAYLERELVNYDEWVKQNLLPKAR